LAEIVEHTGKDGVPLGEESTRVTGVETGERRHEIVAGVDEEVSGEVERGVEESVEAGQAVKRDEPGGRLSELAEE
jgi:hypothetical protein